MKCNPEANEKNLFISVLQNSNAGDSSILLIIRSKIW